MEPDITAGGGVVFREKDGRARYLLVHRPAYRDWTLAKGKPERGESLEEAALREVEEETGITGISVRELGAIRYHTSRGRKKLVHYWLMRAASGSFRPNPEVDAAEWLSIGKATERLTYTRDRAVLEWAHRVRQDPNRGRIYAVHHGRTGTGKGPNGDRPLSATGRRQAHALASLLTRVPVARIVSGPSPACLETVAPLAAAVGIDTAVDPRLAAGTPTDLAQCLIGDLAGASAVVCSDGALIQDLIRKAAGKNAKIAGGLASEHGSTWVVDSRKQSVERATSLPPLATRFS